MQNGMAQERYPVLERGGGVQIGALGVPCAIQESAGKKTIRRGSDRRQEGTHGTGCHFMILSSKVVGDNSQTIVRHEKIPVPSGNLLLGPPMIELLVILIAKMRTS